MALVHGLVPARFLTLTAHLVIVITIFWSRDNNVRASLPLQYTQQEYERRDVDHRGPRRRRRVTPLLPLRAVGRQPLLVDLCLLQRPARCPGDPAFRLRLRVQEEAPVSRSRAPREVCAAGPTGLEPGGGYTRQEAHQCPPLLFRPGAGWGSSRSGVAGWGSQGLVLCI
ncbi:transmembrane protein 107 isoform X1 [Emydura macquarii macquarii]|uniref:transmembrane protein 107 isoform X1 n=1 Tax=Emydura macquarii macquarii TaxID=1129001 RepID=UPI00352B3190